MRTLSSVLALSLLTSAAWAQCFDTAYGTAIGTPGSMFGDQTFPMQPIGFPFPIGGTTYTDMVVCDKGYVWLSNGGVPVDGGVDISPTAAEFASASPRVAALWTDVRVTDVNNGMVYVKSTPTACTISWINAQCFGGTSGVFSMQMVLGIAGDVKVLFGPGTTNNSTLPQWQIGVTGISPGLGATLPAASDLSAGGSTTDPLVYEEFTLPNTFDLANNGLLFAPSSPGYAFVPLGAPVNCAAADVFGTGCGQQVDSFYEIMPAAAFDLANTTITYFRQPDSYLVLGGLPGTWVAPSAGAVVVANFDDAEEVVTLTGAMPVPGGTTTQLTVCSNGRIALGGIGNGVDWAPVAQTFLDFAATTIAANWHDYDQTATGSGAITFEQVGTTAYVTWNGVYSYFTTSPDSFQYQFDVATGNVTIVYGSFGLAGGDCLVGYSYAGPSTAQPIDVSAALATPISVFDNGAQGLGLAANTSPTLGNAAFAMVTTGIPSLVPVGVLFAGDTAVVPGLDLTFLGMPGCFGYTNANLTSVTFAVAGGTGTVALPIPNVNGLIGLSFTCQSLAFSLVTPSNLITSNGLELTVGL